MKKYYVNYYNGFSNCYDLMWAETSEQTKKAEENGYERITRRQAEKLCAAENDRRKYDLIAAGYAANVIYPMDWDSERYCGNWTNDSRLIKDGYTIIYKN